MHVIRNSNVHSNHSSPSNSHTSPLNRIEKPRWSKGPSNTKKHGEHHIEINSAALEAFLRQYAPDDDENPPLGTNFNTSQTGKSPIPTRGSGVRDIEDDWDNLSGDSAWDGSSYGSRSSSPMSAASKSPGLDLIALIPPSALAPYLPQPGLAHELLDIYFLELPSAKLMFDQRNVVRRYRDSTLPNQILFSIFALACLYRAASVSPADQNQASSATRKTYEQGRIWAELASQMALTKSDVASPTTIRACEQISLYWFAVGERDRANVHAGVAYRLYRTMVRSFPDRQQVMAFNRAIWLHDTLSEYQKPYQDTTRFQSLYPQYKAFMRDKGLSPEEVGLSSKTQHEWSDRVSVEDYSSSNYAIGAVGLWREVNAFLRESINSPVKVDFALSGLEHRLQKFHDALPGAIRAKTLMDFQLAGPAQDAMLSFTLIHCANLIALHSTRVPTLTNMKEGRSADSDTSECIIKEMAQIAGELIHEHISNFSKGRKIVPMTGYCVFAIGAVHAHMNEFRDGPGWSEPWIYGASCLLLLEHIGSYWPVLGKLCENLRRRFSYSDPNMMTIPTKVLWQLAVQRGLQKKRTDQLATGFFSIPYSTSFVHEMLGLEPDSHTTSQNTRASSPDDLGSNAFPTYSYGKSVIGDRSLYPEVPAETNSCHPASFIFEANLLGTIPPMYR